jgi:glycosyltransferase involved in cell wall biosynthesis
MTVQRTFTIMRRHRHPHGFAQRTAHHMPYDTLWRLRSMSPDVIIAGELGFRTVQAVTYRRWLAPTTKLIVWATLSEITELAWGRMRRLLRTYVLPRADALLVNGASGRRYVSSFGVPEARIFTVPYTTDMTPFQAVSLERGPECRRRLLYCGQLIERKGLQPFIATLCGWAERHVDQRVELWFVGDGPLRRELEGAPRPPNLIFHFAGHVPYCDLPAWYALAGILVFPTLADEWGLVVNEALAAGVPVLSSLYGQAVEELINDGKNGWTFRPDRAEEMSSALDRALSLPDPELEAMRIRARRSVEHLTPAFVADRILDAVRFVLADPRAAPTLP